jgi:hypothetical protein
MKNNDDIPTTDTNEIKQLINRVKRGELDQGDELLIEHLHQLEQPNVKIYLTGQPLISATKYERRVLRCSDCFKRYAADLPEGVKENEKFDETADVAIALYKYSGGMPFYRQARMQESCGVPLPESVQFERCEEVANAGFPVYRHLVKLAADGKLFHVENS